MLPLAVLNVKKAEIQEKKRKVKRRHSSELLKERQKQDSIESPGKGFLVLKLGAQKDAGPEAGVS